MLRLMMRPALVRWLPIETALRRRVHRFLARALGKAQAGSWLFFHRLALNPTVAEELNRLRRLLDGHPELCRNSESWQEQITAAWELVLSAWCHRYPRYRTGRGAPARVRRLPGRPADGQQRTIRTPLRREAL